MKKTNRTMTNLDSAYLNRVQNIMGNDPALVAHEDDQDLRSSPQPKLRLELPKADEFADDGNGNSDEREGDKSGNDDEEQETQSVQDPFGLRAYKTNKGRSWGDTDDSDQDPDDDDKVHEKHHRDTPTDEELPIIPFGEGPFGTYSITHEDMLAFIEQVKLVTNTDFDVSLSPAGIKFTPSGRPDIKKLVKRVFKDRKTEASKEDHPPKDPQPKKQEPRTPKIADKQKKKVEIADTDPPSSSKDKKKGVNDKGVDPEVQVTIGDTGSDYWFTFTMKRSDASDPEKIMNHFWEIPGDETDKLMCDDKFIEISEIEI
ncbi:P protein [Rhizoctonia solani rhabdovirus 2]|nr:P protein [Rhizoctonia solani rhabdovirus 2]